MFWDPSGQNQSNVEFPTLWFKTLLWNIQNLKCLLLLSLRRAENTIDMAYISRFMNTVPCLICFKKKQPGLQHVCPSSLDSFQSITISCWPFSSKYYSSRLMPSLSVLPVSQNRPSPTPCCQTFPGFNHSTGISVLSLKHPFLRRISDTYQKVHAGREHVSVWAAQKLPCYDACLSVSVLCVRSKFLIQPSHASGKRYLSIWLSILCFEASIFCQNSKQQWRYAMYLYEVIQKKNECGRCLVLCQNRSMYFSTLSE